MALAILGYFRVYIEIEGLIATITLDLPGRGTFTGASCDHVIASLVYRFVLRDDSTIESLPAFPCEITKH